MKKEGWEDRWILVWPAKARTPRWITADVEVRVDCTMVLVDTLVSGPIAASGGNAMD
jgi:hypothetical protein